MCRCGESVKDYLTIKRCRRDSCWILSIYIGCPLKLSKTAFAEVIKGESFESRHSVFLYSCLACPPGVASICLSASDNFTLVLGQDGRESSCEFLPFIDALLISANWFLLSATALIYSALALLIKLSLLGGATHLKAPPNSEYLPPCNTRDRARARATAAVVVDPVAIIVIKSMNDSCECCINAKSVYLVPMGK